ncbi:Thiomethylgalactoside permease II [Serratia odorifera]|uniref:Thiomethylgalactoside permease II n=1 Tax=Serratia odorifera TaxID=618 RepID=A0A3S4EY40_SEROD|nr:Thiomethylgalactoside permease II [Serratia odorifera]
MITKGVQPLGRSVTLGHQLAYGGGNLLGSGALAISGAWLLYFYTTFCGLTLLEASFIFSVASVIDAISNPVMGYLTDNFGHTWLGKRFGRRRFFVLIGAPLMLFYPLLWVEGFGFWYYLSTYVIFELIYTSVMVPYETLATEMTDDFAVRSKLTGYKAIFGKMANFLAAFIPGQFILLYGKESAQPFLYTGITYGLILFIAVGMLYRYSWERKDDGLAVAPAKRSLMKTLVSLARDMQSTFYLRVFRKHLGMYLFGFGAEWLFASVFTYYVIFVLQYDPAILAGLNSLNAMLQLFSTAVFIGLCVKKGFSKPYSWALRYRDIFRRLLFIAAFLRSANAYRHYSDYRDYRAVRSRHRRGVLHPVDGVYLPGRRGRSVYRSPSRGDLRRRDDLFRQDCAFYHRVYHGGDPQLLRLPVQIAYSAGDGDRGDLLGILCRRGDPGAGGDSIQQPNDA